MDTFIADRARDARLSNRCYLGLLVERTVSDLGLMDYFVDSDGNGPYMQAVISVSTI